MDSNEAETWWQRCSDSRQFLGSVPTGRKNLVAKAIRAHLEELGAHEVLDPSELAALSNVQTCVELEDWFGALQERLPVARSRSQRVEFDQELKSIISEYEELDG